MLVAGQRPNALITLDLTGLSCPGPILGVKKLIMQLREGEVMLLVSDCPGTKDDLFSWAARTHNRVLSTERHRGDAVGYFIERGPASRPVADAEIDARGSVCPGPIAVAHRALAGLRGGALLKLTSDCPGDRADIEAWARRTGIGLEDVVALGAHTWEFYLRKP
ncbi:MAG: sulfurtransferase TusA family protein [Burkholderiales bacterium]|nr:MAG: sulfurtransferase TusA family protein [Burkholderiales bacterium]